MMTTNQLRQIRAVVAKRIGKAPSLTDACDWELTTEVEIDEDGVERHRHLIQPISIPAPQRPPNKNAPIPSFAAMLLMAIDRRFEGNAAIVYKRAGVARQNYHKIVSDDSFPVTKRTAIRFCFALRLSLDETETMLKAAGYAFSDAIAEDVILKSCLTAQPPVHNWIDVDALLSEYGIDYSYGASK